MIRREFMKSAVTLGAVSASGLSLGAAPAVLPKKKGKAKYRGGVLGLGWMGVLYDMGTRDYENIVGSYKTPKYDLESAKRPTPDWLDVHRKFHHHDHPGKEGLVATYAEALWDRPEVELVAGADRDKKRLAMFGERYGIEALYTDALEMYEKENLDILAIATNTKRPLLPDGQGGGGRSEGDLRGQAHDLHPEGGRRYGQRLRQGRRPSGGGGHHDVPSVVRQGQGADYHRRHRGRYLHRSPRPPVVPTPGLVLLRGQRAGLGQRHRRQAPSRARQHRVHGTGDHRGQGRHGGPHPGRSPYRQNLGKHGGNRLRRQALDPMAGRRYPLGTQGAGGDALARSPVRGSMRTPWCLDDLIATMEGRMKEPKNSGRIVAAALEAELAMKQSSDRGGERVDLPLKDRSLGLTYDWFR